MDTMEKKEVMQVIKKHTFYCDYCGKQLGETFEADDGYYPTFGSFAESICVKHNNIGWIGMKGNLCKDCADLVSEDIRSAITDIAKKYNLTITH